MSWTWWSADEVERGNGFRVTPDKHIAFGASPMGGMEVLYNCIHVRKRVFGIWDQLSGKYEEDRAKAAHQVPSSEFAPDRPL